MKRKIVIVIIIFILIIIGVFLIMGLTNKTFFKNYYEANNLNNEKIKILLPLFSYYEGKSSSATTTFSTLRSVKSIQIILNEYVENLQSCYDEGYFYDSDLDITISRYYIEDGFPFNKIILSYENGNYCENEYVLDDDWMINVIERAEIQEIVITKYEFKNDNVNYSSKQIDVKGFQTLYNYLSDEKVIRIENNKNINFLESDNSYSISVYYVLDKMGYVLSAFIYDDNYLAFKITDANDHSKNAIYKTDENNKNIFKNIYNNY